MPRDVLWRHEALYLEECDVRGDAEAIYVIVRGRPDLQGSYVLSWAGYWNTDTPDFQAFRQRHPEAKRSLTSWVRQVWRAQQRRAA